MLPTWKINNPNGFPAIWPKARRKIEEKLKLVDGRLQIIRCENTQIQAETPMFMK
jgi:hypothetical protein